MKALFSRPRRRRNPFATLALVVVATVAVFGAVGLAQATFPHRSAAIVLSWQGALALCLTLAWGVADSVLLRRRARPPFADRPAAKRALIIRVFSGVVALVILAVDLGLLVTAGMAVKAALLIGGAFLIAWLVLVGAVFGIVTLRRQRYPRSP